MAKAGLTGSNDFSQVQAREIDFVTRFAKNWEALKTILGIMRAIPRQSGTRLVSYEAKMKSDGLQGGASVGEGEDIPYTEFEVVPAYYKDIEIEKYAKAVPIEAVNKYGVQVAVEKTDDAFLAELQGNVMKRFYNFLNTGTLVSTAPTFQMALAMAKGTVLHKFSKMRRNITEVVGFCNILDVYQYIGAAEITTQTAFGLTYITDFMGYSTLILGNDEDIPRGKVIALPVENIDLYYIDPSNSDFAQLGLEYRTDGDTNLIGFHANGDYSKAVGESFAIMGITLWAEYIDGIAVVSVNDATMTDATVGLPSAESYWGTAVTAMQENIAIAGNKINGTLKKLTSGQLVTDWGEGYFLAVKFTGFSSGVTYNNVKVGLVPSVSSGLVTLDSDQDAVMKVTDKDNQKLTVIQTFGDKTRTQYFDLSGLTLE